MYNLYNLSQTGKNIYEEAVNECAHEYGEAGWQDDIISGDGAAIPYWRESLCARGRWREGKAAGNYRV